MKRIIPNQKMFALLAGLGTGLAFSAQALTTLSSGHADIGIAYEDHAWDLHVHDGDNDEEHEPGDVILQVGAPAQTTVPNNALFTNFLGAAGSPVWILPQAEDEELLFLGLGTEEIEAGVFVGDTVKLSLVSVTGPGRFALYNVNGFGVPSVKMNTRDGIDANDAVNLPVSGHQHLNWAFSAPGNYTLRFQVSGTLDNGLDTVVASGVAAYKFKVVPKANLTKGHADIGLAFEDGEWDLHVHDGENDEEYGPREALLHVRPQAQTTVPNNPAFTAFLGAAGSPVWILPQAEDEQLLFLGLGTEEIEAGVFVGDSIELSLVAVDGPGEFLLYSVNGFGVPSVKFNTRDGIGASDVVTVLAGGHAHYNWAFSAPGTYKIALQAVATLDDGLNTVVDSGPVEYTFLVAAADTNKPTVLVVSPKSNSSTNAQDIALIGTARDNVRVAAVMVSHNGGDYQSVTLGSNAMTVNWSAPLTLTPGANTVAVKAMDKAGNESVLVNRSFYFNVPSALTVITDGVGDIVGKASPIGTPAHGASLLVGRSYQLTAKPGAGYLFSNWSGDMVSGNPVLSFVMQSNLTLTANFIPNPFLPASGKYHGLFADTTGAAHHSAGFFHATVKPNLGYSGKLLLDGDTIGFSGKFTLPGTVTQSVSRAKFGKSDLTLGLVLNVNGDQITGTVSTTNWTAELAADKAVYNPTNPATAYAGNYTMLKPGFTNANDGPSGYGYGIVNVASNGTVKIAGGLADNHKLAQSVPLSGDGYWPFYAPLYPGTNVVGPNTIKNFKGSILGWIQFTNGAPVGNMVWNKTGWTNGFYDSGFTLPNAVVGSAYAAPAAGQRALAITNGSLTLSDGNLTAPLLRGFNLSTNNVLTLAPTNQLVKLKLTPKTGLLKGTFQHPDNTNKLTTLTGAILQNQNYGGGFFLGTNQGGLLILAPLP